MLKAIRIWSTTSRFAIMRKKWPLTSFPSYWNVLHCDFIGRGFSVEEGINWEEHQLNTKPTEKATDSELSWLNVYVLIQETCENVQELINLQKALFELEETNKHNRIELQHIDDAIARHQVCKLPDQFQLFWFSRAWLTKNHELYRRASLELCCSIFPFLSVGKNTGLYNIISPSKHTVKAATWNLQIL